MAVWNVIDDTVLSSAATYYDLSSIDQSYDHLCLRISTRSDEYNHYGLLHMRVNNDGGNNYSDTYFYMAAYGDPTGDRNAPRSAAYAYAGISADYTGSGGHTDAYSPAEIWIPNYSNATRYKQIMIKGDIVTNQSSATRFWLWQSSVLWHSTAAINRIQLSSAKMGWGSEDFMAHSSFTLYGILGA